eukprot:NODE_2358_length_713_cov_104.503012_g1911_i0.p3 GENE.NODE_2358_length_713_cov_104.503012_g1911_i0~~NODE_2358_length_713_cov_104.503012_g1911_i0.p3  ORF type:complete len:90 (-),score=5.41 NODE_2358_length_713_cov_104.503012_g1911_i0:253-522(-)
MGEGEFMQSSQHLPSALRPLFHIVGYTIPPNGWVGYNGWVTPYLRTSASHQNIRLLCVLISYLANPCGWDLVPLTSCKVECKHVCEAFV